MASNIANTHFAGQGANYATQIGQLIVSETKDDRQIITQWLSPLNFSRKQADVFSSHQPGTGEWFIRSPKFQDWLAGKIKVLWGHGIHGSGKTVLMSIVTEHLRQLGAAGPEEGLATIYCEYKLLEIQTPANLLAGIWRQLVQNLPVLPAEARALYEKHAFADTNPSMDEVLSVLSGEIAKRSVVSILIDAIDECPSSIQKTLFRNIQGLFSMPILQKTQIRLIVTSCLSQSPFPDAEYIELLAAEGDVGLFVRETIAGGVSSISPTLSSLVQADPELQAGIVNAVVSKAKGMFLMARMYMDILEDQTSLRDVRDALQNLPEELDDLYQEAWASIQTQKPGHRRLAQQVVHWLSSAFTQMTIEQLRQALAVRNGDSKLDSESLPEVDALIPVCQGLVKIDRESKVIRLAHYTTQIFFDGIRSASFPDVHQDIATTCLTYLMFDTFEQGPCQFISSRAFDIGGARGEIKSSSILARRIAHNPLMFYAAHHWGDHARGTPEKAIESHILTFLKMPQRLASAIQARYVGSEYQYDGALKATGSLALHVVVCFGLEHILQRLLGTLSKIEINGIDCRGKTALHWAVESRSTNIAQLLLQAGADLDSPIRGEKSLSNRMIMGAGAKISEWKWRVGNELDEETFAKGDLVYIAVESNQDVLLSNYISKCTSGSEVKKRANNVLCKASLLDKPDLIELALGLGADIDTRDHQGKTPLIVAVERLHSDAVQTLTSKGASTNMKYGSGGETYLLQQAIESQGVFDDRLTLVRKFFVTTLEERHFGKRPRQTPANSDVVDKLGDVFRSKPTLPLPQNTAQYRRFLVALHEDRTQGQIIEALLDHEADLSVKTPNGQTLLHLGICSASRLDIILKDSQKNVRKIPDVNAKDAKGRTALHYAAAAGNSAAMQTLLSHGADIKAKDSDSATVLHFAVETYDCISVALQKGATVDATDSSGRSPAHYYAMLADDPDPDNLTPWQKAQLRPSLDKDEREAAGKNSEHFMYLPRNCDNASGLLLDKAYREAKIVGSIAKDMYGKTLYDYTFATKEAQRGFKDTAAWLKQMKERYKLRAKAVEEAVTHTLKESQRKRETWSMDIDEIIGREKRWYIEGDNDVEETLDAREALPKRRMFFDGEKPDELDSRHLFLIPT